MIIDITYEISARARQAKISRLIIVKLLVRSVRAVAIYSIIISTIFYQSLIAWGGGVIPPERFSFSIKSRRGCYIRLCKNIARISPECAIYWSF